MGEKQTFVMYKSWRPLFKSLPAEQAKDLICAVYDYQVTGRIETNDSAVIAMFSMIKETMDNDARKYEETCKKRKQAGSMGGKASAEVRSQKKANASSDKANGYQMKPNGNQNIPNHNQIQHESESDSEYESVIDNEYVSERDIVSNSDELDMSAEPTANNSYKVPYQEIVKAYHETCVSLPGIRAVSDARRKLMRSRYHEHGLDAIKIVFEKAEASDFLTGRKEPYWNGCGFDWLMKPSNFLKVLEGNYDNKKNRSSPNSNNPFLDLLNEEMRGDSG